MTFKRVARTHVSLLGLTVAGTCGLLTASPAWAVCTNNSGIVVCTAAAPNPDTNGAFGSDITLQAGARVTLNDPFAGTSPATNTVVVFANGRLTTAAGSEIQDINSGTLAVRAQAGTTISHSGAINAFSSNSVGIVLGENANLTVNAGGSIQTFSSTNVLPSQDFSAAIGASGAGTTINVNGTVRTFGNNVSAIRPVGGNIFGVTTSPTTVNVGATGLVSTIGTGSHAISVPGGSSITVAGTVQATGANSNAIAYQAGSGDLIINLQQGGTIRATQAPAINGDGANVRLTIAGKLTGPGAGLVAVSLGSGNDRVTVTNTASITGLVSGGAGTDRIAFSAADNVTRSFDLTPFTGFEILGIDAGSWTPAAALTSMDAIEVSAGATLTSSTSATVSPAGTNVSITNSGTINTTNATGRAINFGGSNNSRIITITNNAGGLITSADDAVRVNFNPTGGTIRVDNYGTIATTNGGQALDFNAAASGSATIIINNYATGVLRGVGQDGIRPGQGAVVTNAGFIISDGAANNSFDAIDWQQSSGTVINQAGGTISGLRHGITSDVNVNVTNDGVIIGRNGSGVGSDGTGTVVNRGTITGQWDGVATNGDGDGVDIDGIGTIRNFGTIQGLTARGVDSGGSPNSAEGIAIGGGLIENNVNAVISGGGSGILVDNGSAGGAFGATTITNNGIIRGGTGYGILMVGNFADTVTNNGLISGGAGALSMGDGNDSLILLAGAQFVGDVDGGQGTDTVYLRGPGGSLDRVTNFEALVVEGSGWTLSRANSFANGMSIATTGSLTGNSSNLTGAITNAGALIVDQSGDDTFGATLIGGGTLIKRGAGTLVIGGQSRFTGTTLVQGGRLALAGTLPGAVQVQTGATLSGNGSVGGLTIGSGGIVAPGNSIGTISVAGNFAALAGSTYLAETSAAGTADLIAVSGTASIAQGTTLVVTRDTSGYTVGQRFTVLTATGGITGTYTVLQQPTDPLTEFRLNGNGTSLYLDLVRTGAGLMPVVHTGNQQGVATALAGLGASNPLYAALTLVSSDDTIRTAFDSLSGELHATLLSAAAKDAYAVQTAALARLDAAGETGVALWLQGLYRDGTDGASRGAGLVRSDTHGVIGGVDASIGETVRVGVAAGWSRNKLDVIERASTGEIESTHLAAYASIGFGPVTLRAAGGYSWTKNETRRAVVFPGISNGLTADYDGTVVHGIADVGYALPFAGGTVEPFAAIEGYGVKSDAFTEAGGVAALTRGQRLERFAVSTLGTRLETPIVTDLSARARLGWRHTFGNRDATSLVRFASGSQAWTVRGTPYSKNAAAASVDLDWAPAPNMLITAGFNSIVGDVGDDQTGKITVTIGF